MKKVKLTGIFVMVLVVMIPIAFANSISLSYDANGNLVSGDGFYREYNSLNQLWKVYIGSDDTGDLLQEYTMHPTEERVLIKVVYHGDGSNTTTYYVNQNLRRVVNSSGSYDYVSVFHEGQRVAELQPDGSKIFFHPDHLGSSSVVSDESGSIVERQDYSPYGLQLSGGEKTIYGYEGKELDDTTGSYDFHFRGYNPEWGVFTQPDSLLPNVFDPQKLNRYSFERSNPYRNTDPTGHFEPITIGIGAYLGYTIIALGLALIVTYTIVTIDMFVNANKAEIEVDNSNTGALQAGEWGDWEYKDFRGKDKWVRESGDEIETWEEDYSHGEPHINNRKYNKKELEELDEWKKNKDGPKPDVNIRDGPNNHQPIKQGKSDPSSYGSKSSKSSGGLSKFWSNLKSRVQKAFKSSSKSKSTSNK